MSTVVFATNTNVLFGSDVQLGADLNTNFNLARVTPLSFVFPGKPAAGAVLHQQIIEALSLSTGLSASGVGGSAAAAWANTAPTSAATFTINYIRPSVSPTTVNQIGTITITAGSKYLTTLVDGSAFSLLPGDVVQVVAPATQDATMSDVAITLPFYVT